MTTCRLGRPAAACVLAWPLLAAAQTGDAAPPRDDTTFQLGRVEINARGSGALPTRRVTTLPGSTKATYSLAGSAMASCPRRMNSSM